MCMHSWYFLGCVGKNCVAPMPELGLTLHFAAFMKGGAVASLVTDGSLDLSDWNMTKLHIWKKAGKVSSRIRILDLRTASFPLFERLVGRILWITVVKMEYPQDSSKYFKENLMEAYE